MADEKIIQKIFKSCIGLIIGFKDEFPLGSIKVIEETDRNLNPKNGLKDLIARLFSYIVESNIIKKIKPEKVSNEWLKNPIVKKLLKVYHEAFSNFLSFYMEPKNYDYLLEKWGKLKRTEDQGLKAKLATEIWMPELSIDNAEIIDRWKLKDVIPNNSPIKPENVAIQLNALYTIPKVIPKRLSRKLEKRFQMLNHNFGEKIAEYDHPVPLFVDNNHHELIKCLEELNNDIEFEKSKYVFKRDFKLCIVISISVTHRNLYEIAKLWIKEIVKSCNFKHLKCLIIGLHEINLIKNKLLKCEIPVFSVSGKYAKHFNSLKYIQLLLEKGYNIKAGFKLDTDEGIRSRDLFNTTRKTWFQTMCHNLWGAYGVDYSGKRVELGINVGEYINNKDIVNLGYRKSMRTPDVKVPDSYISEDIFFNKCIAHGRMSLLYNSCNDLNDYISHPVVKGGAYGITNDSLKKYVPFAFSRIGRAEDQGFYISAISKGLIGIFNPDLRIAHYKEQVSSSEKRTEVTRFIGDMYRLILFEHIVKILGIKDKIDPMPGVFAGKLARSQAFFNIIYKAYYYCTIDMEDNALFLLKNGIDELEKLKRDIDSSKIKIELENESEQWLKFVEIAEKIDKATSKEFFGPLFI